jgi:hypothetical protein
MTMRKTIDIPASRNVHFDLVVPESVPCGKTNVILEFPQEPVPPDTTAADEAAAKPDIVYPPDTPHWLIGAVNPELFGTIKTVGDIIGPFHDVWNQSVPEEHGH